MALKLFGIFKTKAAQEQLSTEMVDNLLQARSMRKEGRLRQAAIVYRLILEAHPDHWESLDAVAALALQGGELVEAVDAYTALIERRRDHAEAYYKRGNAQNGLGKLREALADYDKALTIDQTFANAFCNRGAVLERLDQWDEALTSYEHAITLNPQDFLSYYNRGSVLKELKRYDEALCSYGQAIVLKPDNAEAHVNQGNVLRQLQRYEAANASYEKAIALSPNDLVRHLAYEGRGLALNDLKKYDEAVASHDQAIKLNPTDHRAYTNRGSVLRKLQRLEEALVSFEQAVALKRDHADAYFYQGQVLQEMGRFEAAIASYDAAIACTPPHLLPYLAHSGRGFALAGLGKFDDAVAAFDKATALNSDYFDAYFARGRVLQALRRYEAAIANYDDAIALCPDDVRTKLVYSSRGFALKELKRFEDALASYDRAIEIEDSDAEAHINRAGVLQEIGHSEEAITSYDRAIVLKPDYVEAHSGKGFALLNRGRYEAALVSFDRAYELQPDMKYLSAFRRYVQMQLCDWRDLSQYLEQLEQKLLAREPASGPFQVLALLDSPHLQRLAAESWVREECPPDDTLGAIATRPRSDKIKIGYFSADFHNHAVSFLTAELFEIHDRSQFEIFAFSFGPKINDAVRARLERAFDRFVDVGEQSDIDAAQTARRLGIDIAVDLGGFTTHARPRIFALRAAPIQMSYIGYLGTLGAPYMDYLLADTTLIPASERSNYSEDIIYLPCYQVNDSTRVVVERTLTRAELGLPAVGFVYSCFNANFKILPTTFSAWMRILKRVKSSSLFLYVGSETAEKNLREEAARCGVDAQRLVFGKFLLHEEYMARLRAMDLFLDTLPYNAGTTASDALWAGLPVLTCAGQAFASRVAASLLNAIGVPELVTSTSAEYEAMAVQLAENPEQLRNIRLKLTQNRIKTALFDTRSFTKHLEVAFREVHQRHLAGLVPETIVVVPNS